MDAFDRESLARALRAEQARGVGAGAALAALRREADRELARALAEQVGLAFETLETCEAQALARVPAWLARRAPLCPVAVRNGQLVLAVEDPTDRSWVEQAGAIAGMPVDVVVAARGDIEAALARWRDLMSREPESLARDVVAAAETGGAVIALLTDALEEAVATGAEELHVEVERDGGRIRFRRGGRFVTATELPRAVLPALVGRIKGIASMDQAEHRLPQSGTLRLRVKGRVLAVTASTLPTLHGEKVVVAVGEEEGPAPSLAALGLTGQAEARVREVLRGPAGWLLVSGPRRSGRRTFAQSAMQAVADERRSAVSIELERTRELAGVTQVIARPEVGLTIATALRTARAQHADAIACEVHDYETSELCARAAIEGAVVVGWVPSASALSGVCRMLDMGLETFIVLEAVKLAQGQRVLRTLCPDCRVAVPAARLVSGVAAALEKATGAVPAETFTPAGCARCRGDGYAGHTGVFEHVVLAGELAEMYAKGATRRELRARATADGWTTLRTEALKLAAAGRISVADAFLVGEDD